MLPAVVPASVYVALFVPTFPTFFFHWYEGVDPPFVGVAVNVTPAPEQVGLEPDVTAILTEGVTIEFTVKAIALLVAVGVVTHVRLLVITTVMLPAVVPRSVYVSLFVPTSTPPFFHWYDGVPPFVGVAVKVTAVPEHVGLDPPVTAILTDGVTLEVTVTAALPVTV